MRTRSRRVFVGLLAAVVATLFTPASAGELSLHLAAAPSQTTEPVTIATVPAVEAFPVTVDGVTALTDAAGKAHFRAAPVGKALSDHLELTETTLLIAGRQVKVSADRLYPSAVEPRLALDLAYLVGFRFSARGDSQGEEPQVETIAVKSATGMVAELPAREGGWLQGSRVVATREGPLVQKIAWRVQRVEIAGSNVVNTSQQRFLPALQQTVDVHLLFFALNLQVHDAMFGFPHRGAVELVYPDGQSRSVALPADGKLVLPDLPRGDYTLTIMGAGPKMPRPVAVSRDQDVELSFYSWLDVATVLGVLLALAVGLAWWGIVRRRRDPASTVPDAAGPAVQEAPRLLREGTGSAAGEGPSPAPSADATDLAVMPGRRTA